MKGKYIILEIVPEAISPDKGSLVQLSALKLNDMKLEDRFDYRVNEKNIRNKDLVEICSYDKDKFNYVNSTEGVMNNFKKWSKGYTLLIIDTPYTYNFLSNINNDKESIFKFINMKYSDDVIDKIINKYHLQPTNYIVDLLYEALLFEQK